MKHTSKNFCEFKCSRKSSRVFKFPWLTFRGFYFRVLVVSRENHENLALSKISCYTVYKHVTCYLGNTTEERYVNMHLLGDGLHICELKLNCMINSARRIWCQLPK